MVRTAGLGWRDVRGTGVVVPGIYDPATGRAWAPNLWGRDEVPLRECARAPSPAGARHQLRPLGLRPRRAVAGRGPRRDRRGLPRRRHRHRRRHPLPEAGSSAATAASRAPWAALALDPRWREDYGRIGSFEAEAAGPAFARRLGRASAEAVAEAARQGDPAARRAVDETVEWLAMGTANLISALKNPQVVVLGGGLMQAADLFLEPLRQAVRRWAQPIAVERCRIEPSRLGEDAALFGAARLALLGQTT